MAKSKYNRILLKLSGEALMGKDAFGVNPETVTKIVREIKVAKDMGVEVAVVVGGGNIFTYGWFYQFNSECLGKR